MDLIVDPERLGRFLACDRSLVHEREVHVAVVKHVRLAWRAFVGAAPPPGEWTRADLRAVLYEARRQTEQRVGLRWVVAVGRRQMPQPRYVPSAAEIARVVESLRQDPTTRVVGDLVGFLYVTGVRIGAALQARRSDLVWRDGSVWLHVAEKSRPDHRALLVRPEHAHLALAWSQLDPEDRLWVADGRPLQAETVRRHLRTACAANGVPRFTPHALRKAFARDLLPAMGLRRVMRAGGWLSSVVLENHYLGPGS